MKKVIKTMLIPAMLLVTSTLSSCTARAKDIAMILYASGIDDGSFNAEVWAGMQTKCKEYGYTYDYYRSYNESDDAINCAVQQAVYKGAKLVILPGFKFANVAATSSKAYPNVKFLLMDATLSGIDKIPDNCAVVTFDSQYSGFMSGFSTTYNYLATDYDSNGGKLRDNYGFAFVGGQNNAGVFPFGYGYVQGVLGAARYFINEEHKDENLNHPNINIKYNYSGAFAQDDSATARVKGWLNQSNPTQCVLVAGGKLYQSINEAVNDFNVKHYPDFEDQNAPRDAARWIGSDGDQYELIEDNDVKKSNYTSALKGLKQVTMDTIDYLHNSEFENKIGGPASKEKGEELTNWSLGYNSKFGRDSSNDEIKAKDYVGIPQIFKDDDSTYRGFNKFNKATHNKIRERIIQEENEEGKISVYGGFSPEFGENPQGTGNVFNSNEWKKDTKYYGHYDNYTVEEI